VVLSVSALSGIRKLVSLNSEQFEFGSQTECPAELIWKRTDCAISRLQPLCPRLQVLLVGLMWHEISRPESGSYVPLVYPNSPADLGLTPHPIGNTTWRLNPNRVHVIVRPCPQNGLSIFFIGQTGDSSPKSRMRHLRETRE